MSTNDFEQGLRLHIQVMKDLAAALGQEWHDESDTHYLLAQVGREHVKAKELQGFIADVQESLLKHQMLA